MYEPILYVAEIGSNHMGDLHLAIELIAAAQKAGAGAVKFQLFRANKLDARPEVQAKLKPFELRPEWLTRLAQEAHVREMKFIVTPFDLEAVDYLAGLVDMVKISAYDLTYRALIDKAASLGVPLILSTAMATPMEIWSSYSFPPPGMIILHGVAKYPAVEQDYSIAKIYHFLEGYFKVGISDHTIGSGFLCQAAQLPICMAEKHFRLFSTPTTSPDHIVSANPKDFADYVKVGNLMRKKAEQAILGGPLPVEMPLFKTCRRSNNAPLRGRRPLDVEPT